MHNKFRGKLYCFSPPVMLATFLIEFGLAFYTFWRYKMDKVSRLAIITFLALGTFQLSEYMVCGGLGLTNIEWARFGYISITLLPALGIHMITTLAGKKEPLIVNAAYATCAAFVSYYLISTNAFYGQSCYANYAVFYTQSMGSQLFTAYYYGWLMIGIYLAWHWGNQLPARRKTLQSMIIGYAVFILPTTFFNITNPATIKGIPSIMCGFAVLFAIVLANKVVPDSCETRIPIQTLNENLSSQI